MGWRTADRIWRLAGDTATDFNHYTKRITLGAVYSSTLLAWLDDKSEGLVESRAFLDRRIANVMSFEKWKAQWRGDPVRRPSLCPLPRTAALPAAPRYRRFAKPVVIDNQSQHERRPLSGQP